MIQLIRLFFWRLLGIKYFNYLKGVNKTYLKDAKWVKIGNRTYDNGAFVWKWYEYAKLEIGQYCSIANNVTFICDSGYHSESEITSFPLFHEILNKKDEVIIQNKVFKVSEIKEKLVPAKKNIYIGNDVLIGTNVTILPNVNIGNGVTILPGAVVSIDIPNYAVAGGVQAYIIKYKYNPDIIQKLQTINWWNWSDDKIKENINDFYLPIEHFIRKHY